MNTIKEADKGYGLFYLKAGCLIFWGSWFSLAAVTNIFDFMYHLDLLADWRFRSGNYKLLTQVCSIYHLDVLVIDIFFILILLTQVLSATLFFNAFFSFLQKLNPWKAINVAFTLSIGLWAMFLIMEEIFIAYAYEATHIRLFIFELFTLMAIQLLPHTRRYS